MAQVVFSFDTEDFTSELSNYAAMRLAEIMTEEGVKGSFNVVGEMARNLVHTNNKSCINALKKHEINYHSLRHSWHPNIVEYSDTDNWLEGLHKFITQETKGIKLVKDAFGCDRLWAAVPPGNSITVQAIHGYKQLGINIYSGSLFKKTKGRGIWYCGEFNLENNAYFEDILLGGHLDAFLQKLDEMAHWDRVVICGHPNMAVYKEFWDAVNMQGENRSSWGSWKEAERREQANVDEYFDGFRTLIRALKKHKGFEIVTYQDIDRQIFSRDIGRLTLSQMPEILDKAVEQFFFFKQGGIYFSLADAFFAAVHFLQGHNDPFVPRRSLGPIDLNEGISKTIYVDRESIVTAAKEINIDNPIPNYITVAGNRVSPGDFLRASREVFHGKDSVQIYPGLSIPNIAGFYSMDVFRLKNTWLHSKDFADKWVTKRLLNQAWTIKPEN